MGGMKLACNYLKVFNIFRNAAFQFGNTNPVDSNQVDTSETVYISSLALLKMLKHGRAGVPMEVYLPFF